MCNLSTLTKIQHATLLARLLFGEQSLRAVGEFEEACALIQVALVCRLMPGDLLH